MMVATLTSALRAPAACLAVRQHRNAIVAAPAAHRRFRAAVVRAQAEENKGQEASAPAPAGERQEGTLAPASRSSSGYALDTLVPSWGRMNQIFQQMDQEMNALSRAFGMPSVGMPSLFTDMPTHLPTAADLPALSAKALAVDIRDAGSSLEITADMPGLSKDDIKVQVSPDRVLTISGERKSEHKEGSEEAGNLRVERSYGKFMRRFRLPDNVDVEGIKASTKDGVLRLTVPKTEEAKPKHIEVQVSE